jgi:hypothetical protein
MSQNFTNLTKSWIINLDKNYPDYNDISQWIDPTITMEHDHLLITGKVVGTISTYSVLVKIFEKDVCKFRCDCPSIRRTKYCCKHCAALCFVYQESRNDFKVINMYDTSSLLGNKNQLDLIDLILNFLIEDPLDQNSILEKLRNKSDQDIVPSVSPKKYSNKSPKKYIKKEEMKFMNTQDFLDSTPLNSQVNSQTSPLFSINSDFEDVKVEVVKSPVKVESGNPQFLKYLESKIIPKLEPIESPMKVEKQTKSKQLNTVLPIVENVKKEISKEEEDVIVLD